MNCEELGEEIMNPVSFLFLELLAVYLTAALEGYGDYSEPFGDLGLSQVHQAFKELLLSDN